MPQDAFTLKYLCKELNDVLKNGKVNKIVQPNNDSVVLTVWTGKKTEKLLLDVNPSSPRIGLIQKEDDSPLTAPNFCMLLRKYLLNATLNSISIINFDRIVKANMDLLDKNKALQYDVLILTQIIEKAKQYAKANKLELLTKILNGEDEE